MNGTFYAVTETPSTIPKMDQFFKHIGPKPLSLIYDIGQKRTIVWTHDRSADLISNLERAASGFKFEKADYYNPIPDNKLCVVSFYSEMTPESEPFQDLFVQMSREGFLALVFVPPSSTELDKSKCYIETSLSTKNTKETHLRSGWLRSRLGNISAHMEIYHDSEEDAILKNILESINSALLTNNLLYKIFMIFDAGSAALQSYINQRFVVFSIRTIEAGTFDEIVVKLSKLQSFPFGANYCSMLLRFYEARRINKIIKTNPVFTLPGGVLVGKLMPDGVAETPDEMRIDPSALNLGTIITGLPGSGKTMEAMRLVDDLVARGIPAFVLAPTDEWNGFCVSHKMHPVRFFSDNNAMNFFRCPSDTFRERFYQDLSIVLSAASGAGPYRRPMEKCLLNAFRKAYSTTGNPDPVSTYNEIEESIIRFHGKRTNSGIKYTKHGENIWAALESLRIILNDPRYSARNGLSMEDLMRSGAVFDMSNASVATKPFLYAMVLNQLYSIASNFRADGDDKLRMLICVEESQIIFKDEDSPAVTDIRQRIQDFRKRGIGLMLLAHNILDIDSGIRRLCQTKLYFRQAPDLAYMAAKELVFTGMEPDLVVDKLKTLDSRVAAFSVVSRQANERVPQETVIVKTAEYTTNISMQPGDQVHAASYAGKSTESTILFDSETVSKKTGDEPMTLKIVYLGEVVSESRIERNESKIQLILGREYKVVLCNGKGRIMGETKIVGSDRTSLIFIDGRLLELKGTDTE
jgi:hypothetical protein